MEKSPILPGEQYKDQSEKQKELAEVLNCNEFLDNLALLREHTRQTHLVSAFSVYKNGSYQVGDVISCLPEEVPSITVEYEEDIIGRPKTIQCQDDLDCTSYSVDPGRQHELLMVIHSHPDNNTHCLKRDYSDLLAPTVEDLDNWQREVTYNRDIIEGILVCEKDCQGLLLFRKNPKQNIQPVWRVFGTHPETITYDSAMGVMLASGLLTSKIRLDCQKSHYHRQVNRAAFILSGGRK